MHLRDSNEGVVRGTTNNVSNGNIKAGFRGGFLIRRWWEGSEFSCLLVVENIIAPMLLKQYLI